MDSPRPLTVRELAKRCGLQINAVFCHLKAMRSGGLVVWEEGFCRTIRPSCRYIPVELLNEDTQWKGLSG